MLFRRFGVDVTGMSREAIKAARRDLLHRHHPDRGGDLDSAQLINAAYDLLKDGVPDEMFYSTDLDLYEAHKAKTRVPLSGSGQVIPAVFRMRRSIETTFLM